MRLTLLISDLSSGGAQRVMVNMANYWAAKGWSITLLTLDNGATPPFYDLHPAIMHRPLGLAEFSPTPIHGILRNLQRLVVLRRLVRESQPEVIIAFMAQTNVLAIIVALMLRVPVIVEEHTDPAHCSPGIGWRILRRLFYPRASAVVVLSVTALNYFSRSVRRRARVIPNPVVAPMAMNASPCERCNDSQESFRLLALGRLSEEKGFDLLLKAFAAVAPQHPAWSLVVWGDGPLRPQLETLRDDLGLRHRAHFPGQTQEPFAELNRGNLFALSSHFEGFPMALCEAMACGLPVVSFDCPSGPREIIRHDVDGILVPPGDTQALAVSLGHLMGDAPTRKRLALRAPDVLDRFGLEKVIAVWEEMLDEVTP